MAIIASVRQFDPVGVFLFPLVFFRKDLFEPMRWLRSDPPIRERGLVSNDELLPATVTPDDAHFLEAGPFLPTSDPSLWRLPSSTHVLLLGSS